MLDLPESPVNYEVGMFMVYVQLHLAATSGYSEYSHALDNRVIESRPVDQLYFNFSTGTASFQVMVGKDN